jgi:tripartite-type tricarboxylate transporter receptor subunit TctC
MSGLTLTRRACLGLSAGAIAVVVDRPADAQPLSVAPSAPAFRPTRMVVPVPPSAAPDLAGRLLAEGLARRRGHPLAVENRAGADGVIGAEAFVQARPANPSSTASSRQ